jgi:hypothetical protein
MNTYNNEREGIDMYDNAEDEDHTPCRLSRAEKVQLWLFGGVSAVVLVALAVYCLVVNGSAPTAAACRASDERRRRPHAEGVRELGGDRVRCAAARVLDARRLRHAVHRDRRVERRGSATVL